MKTRSSITITVDPASLARSDHGQVSGLINILIDTVPYPDARWSDSVVSLLGLWADSAQRLLRGEDFQTTLRFLDGPYYLGVEVVDRSHWLLQPLRVANSAVHPREIVVSSRAFCQTLVEASTITLRACNERIWWSPEIDRLVVAQQDLMFLAEDDLI